MPQPANLTTGADRAFPSHPRLDRYFPSASAEEGRQRLSSCIERGDGPAVVIGASGYGKTMLLDVLAGTFADRFTLAHLSNSQLCTRRALLQAILHAVGQPHRDREEGDLRLALADFLQDQSLCPTGVLLLVDEAQTFSARLLEELRMLGNLARDGQPLVRMVLAGALKLEESLAAPELETLNQRIAARCYLAPLTYDELNQYIRSHIAAAGANPDQLLGADAAAAVFEATDGIPRLINQLCDRAIVLAVEAGAQQIDRRAIQNAWADLQQLPAPWNSLEPEQVIAQAAFAAPEEIEGAMSAGVGPVADPSIIAYTPAAEATPEPVSIAKPVWNADTALAEVAAAEPAAGSPAAAELFGDDFDEEETVLDRFITADIPFPPGTPIVTNQIEGESDISTLVAQFTPADGESESVIATPTSMSETLANVNEPVQMEKATVADDLAPAPSVVGVSFPTNDQVSDDDTEVDEVDEIREVAFTRIDTPDDAGLLLIEDDPTPVRATAGAVATVHRREYRQLFTSLRGV